MRTQVDRLRRGFPIAEPARSHALDNCVTAVVLCAVKVRSTLASIEDTASIAECINYSPTTCSTARTKQSPGSAVSTLIRCASAPGGSSGSGADRGATPQRRVPGSANQFGGCDSGPRGVAERRYPPCIPGGQHRAVSRCRGDRRPSQPAFGDGRFAPRLSPDRFSRDSGQSKRCM